MQTVQTYTSVPAFAGTGSKVAPSGGAYSTGYLQGQRLPASHANYFWGNLTLNGVTEQGALLDTQTEFNNALSYLGQGSLAGTGDSFQLAKTMIGLSNVIGEVISSEIELTPVIWTAGTADYLPIIARHDADHDITTAQAPDLVSAYRAQIAKINVAGVITSSWTGTVSGSTITFANTPENIALLTMYSNEALANGYIQTQTATFSALYTGTAQRSINVNGVDFAVAGSSVGGLTLAITGTPTAGVQTVIPYTYRIAGSTTSVRLPKISGFTNIVTYDYDGNFVAGWRRMDQGQGHWHQYVVRQGATGFGSGSIGQVTATGSVAILSDGGIGPSVPDGVNGNPRAGKTTDPRGFGVYVYTWARRLLA